MTIPLLLLAFFILYLSYERVILNRLRRSIPLVIAVTGTRGKSSVVRMLASVLREQGKRVLAKTTGSQAQLLLPDGSIQDIPRRGIVSILEQKKILNTAADLNIDCLVVEIMSIRPENHIVEAQQILKPDIVILTNVRRDHVEAMGETEAEIAEVLKKDFPRESSVYLLQEYVSLFGTSGSNNTPVAFKAVTTESSRPHTTEFAENVALVRAVSKDLGVSEEVVATGLQLTQRDIGSLRIWKHTVHDKRVFLVNAFAANDPDSTRMIYSKVAHALSAGPASFTGLLNLRYDRPDRTVQWIDALNNGSSSLFRTIYALDGHSHVLRRKTRSVKRIAAGDAKEITESLTGQMQNGDILFGFGNIGGMGRELVEHWQKIGDDYGL